MHCTWKFSSCNGVRILQEHVRCLQTWNGMTEPSGRHQRWFVGGRESSTKRCGERSGICSADMVDIIGSVCSGHMLDVISGMNNRIRSGRMVNITVVVGLMWRHVTMVRMWGNMVTMVRMRG